MTVSADIQPQRRSILPAITPQTRDHVLLTIWLIITIEQFPYDQLILYPMALYFTWAFIRDFRLIFPVLMHSLILFALPAWWLLSAFWGQETGLIIKSGMQLVLTFMICHCVVLRLERRQIILSLMIAAGIFGVASLVVDPSGGVAARGTFSSKNAMGAAMVLLWLASLATLLERENALVIRLIAAGLALVAVRMIMVSNSATAVLLAITVAAIVIVLGVMAPNRSLARPGFVAFVALFLCAVFFALIALFTMGEFNPVAELLGAFGKDTTLTGRTDLWNYAMAEISQRPLLGIGEGGFWRPEDWTSEARRIYFEFHKGLYAKFSFHNSFLEIAVHLGLIGAGLAALTFLWCLWQILVSVVRNATIPTVFFLAIAVNTFAASMTESGFMYPFSFRTMLLVIGALLAVRERIGGVAATR